MPDKVDSFLFISHFRNCDGGEESLFNMTVLTCHATDVPPTNGPAGPSMAAMDGPAGLTTVP